MVHINLLKKHLKASGVTIIQKHIDNIEEIYQMSDCYIFPVVERSGAVGFPLSVIEAMACNLPVVSMRFEALPYFLTDGNGVYFVSSDAEMVSKVKEISRNCITNDNCLQAMDFSWARVSEKIMSIVTEVCFS